MFARKAAGFYILTKQKPKLNKVQLCSTEMKTIKTERKNELMFDTVGFLGT
jgi:hypothetical protein